MDYKSLPLKKFFEICETKNLELLVVEGEFTQDELVEMWDSILETNAEVTNGADYGIYVDSLRKLNLALAEYNMVYGMLTVLSFQIDDEYLAFLKKKGYRIDTSKASTYAQTLTESFHRARLIVTKIKMAHNKLVKEYGGEEQDIEVAPFEYAVSTMSVAVGYHVPDDVTLARFNEMKKVLKLKNKAA